MCAKRYWHDIFLQVLGPKPVLKEGTAEEDIVADQKNAIAAVLYKVIKNGEPPYLRLDGISRKLFSCRHLLKSIPPLLLSL